MTSLSVLVSSGLGTARQVLAWMINAEHPVGAVQAFIPHECGWYCATFELPSFALSAMLYVEGFASYITGDTHINTC